MYMLCTPARENKKNRATFGQESDTAFKDFAVQKYLVDCENLLTYTNLRK